MHRTTVASVLALCGAFGIAPLSSAFEPQAPAAVQQPRQVSPGVLKVARVEGTVAWPTSGGNPTAATAVAACGAVKVSAVKEVPSGGMVPKTETVGETTAKPVDAADVKKGCTYALVPLPQAQPLKISARFSGAWSSPLGGGGVWSEATPVTLKPGVLKVNLQLKVNAIK